MHIKHLTYPKRNETKKNDSFPSYNYLLSTNLESFTRHSYSEKWALLSAYPKGRRPPWPFYCLFLSKLKFLSILSPIFLHFCQCYYWNTKYIQQSAKLTLNFSIQLDRFLHTFESKQPPPRSRCGTFLVPQWASLWLLIIKCLTQNPLEVSAILTLSPSISLACSWTSHVWNHTMCTYLCVQLFSLPRVSMIFIYFVN